MTDTGAKRSLGLSTEACAAIWFAGIGIPAGVVAYYTMVSHFRPRDDEGTLMMSVKQYLDGAKLYREVFSGYGPVYYFYNWLIRMVSRTAVDHNATRTTSAVVWVLCSLLCAWIVYRLTKSLPVAAVAQVLVFGQFVFFRAEPGHPQELCMLLLLCLVASGLLARSRYRWLAMLFVGMLVAAMALIKVNLGVFVILAAALAIVVQLPQTCLVRTARYAVGLAALVLPAVLMKVHLRDSTIQGYCAVVIISIGALLATSRADRVSQLHIRDLWIAMVSFGATTGLVLLIVKLQGTRFSDMLSSLILLHLKTNVQQSFWYSPLYVRRLWTVWALAGLFAALAITSMARCGRRLNSLLAPAKLLFGVGALWLAATVPANLIGFVTPFSWLLLVPPPEDEALSFPRMLLCTTTVLQTLYAYPIAGSQAMFVRVLLIVVGAVSCGDFLRTPAIQLHLESLRPALGASMWLVLLLVIVYYGREGLHARRTYESLTPLALPGAERIRVPVDQARSYQWLVQNLKEYCDGFVGYPEMPSLHLWSGVPSPGPLHEPPGPLYWDVWMQALTPDQQEIIAKDFSRFSKPCVVYIPKLVAFWNKSGQDWSGLPLVKYIQQNFKTVGETDGYYFLIHNERQLATPIAKP